MIILKSKISMKGEWRKRRGRLSNFYIDKIYVFLICYTNQEDSSQKPFDFAQGRESFDFTQDHELVEWRVEWSTSRKK